MALAPFGKQLPVPSHGGKVVGHAGLVLHVQAGNGSCYGMFSKRGNKKSSTFWVSKSGVIEQYVDSDEQAWAQAAGNAGWASVETEGFPDEPLTAAQIAALAQLYRWGHEAHGWPYRLAEVPQGSGFGWHGMGGAAWGGHPSCPGELRKAERQHILELAQCGITKEQALTLVIEPVGAVARLNIDTNGWVFGARGHVYQYGAAPYCGGWDDPTRNDLARRCVALVPTASGNGYWLVSNAGETYGYGDAPGVGNYQTGWGAGVIVGAVPNHHTSNGGVTLLRDDGRELHTYGLPA